ncbi:MAG: hypothetical protein AAFV29_25020, partial [Myxococcota bacterium]
MQLYTKILIGMGVGVVLGFLVGPNSSLLPQDGVKLTPQASVRKQAGGEVEPLASGIKLARLTETQAVSGAEWLKIEWHLTAPDLLRLKAAKINVGQARAGMKVTGWVANDTTQVQRYAPIGQSIVDYTEWIGRLFLAL